MKKILPFFLSLTILFSSAPTRCDKFYVSCFKLIITTAVFAVWYSWYYDTKYNPFKKSETNQNNQLNKEESKGMSQ